MRVWKKPWIFVGLCFGDSVEEKMEGGEVI